MSYKLVGSETFTATSAILKSTVPTIKNQAVHHWLIQCTTADIRWTDDPNFALSASVGFRMVADAVPFKFEGDFKNFRCIAVSGSPVVFIHKYAGRSE